ncbi:MAG: YqgE/AlgH family protein [Acidimicrobiia bacterium]|jgi:putative transcriptional regulator
MTGGSLAGSLLVASPLLLDPNFVRAVIYLLHHDDEGAVGVVLNRPSEEPVTAHLPAWSGALVDPAVVFVGGPVEPAVAIGLTAEPGSGEPTPVPGIALVDLSGSPGLLDRVRVFSGYAGWGAGQLEGELEEGSWIVVDAEPADPFSTDPAGLWRWVLRRQGGRLALVSLMPPDPSMN